MLVKWPQVMVSLGYDFTITTTDELWISIFGYEYLEFTTIVKIHNSVMDTIMGHSSIKTNILIKRRI